MFGVFLHDIVAEAVIMVLGGFGKKLQGVNDFAAILAVAIIGAVAAIAVAITISFTAAIFLIPTAVPVAVASIALGLGFILLPGGYA